MVNLVDVALRRIPGRLTSTIRYAVGSGPLSNIVDRSSVTVGTKVDRRAPIVIAPPLRGSGWWGANACCDPAGSHRSGLLAIDGKLTIVEAFALDYQRIVDGSIVKGSGPDYTSPTSTPTASRSTASRTARSSGSTGEPDAPWPPTGSGPPNPAVT